MKRVVIESPFAAGKPPVELTPEEEQIWAADRVEQHIRYARAAMHDCLVHRSEAPYASHLLYTQEGVLDDNVPKERELGIHAGFVYREVTEVSAFYVDLGMSRGMQYGIENAEKMGHEVEFRMFLDGLTRPSLNVLVEAKDGKFIATAVNLRTMDACNGEGATLADACAQLAMGWDLPRNPPTPPPSSHHDRV